MKKRNQKGFTLAELLIVVAIIAVLVAIAIPVFTRQLERSREQTDLSNIRSAYAELVTAYLTDGGEQNAYVPVKQKQANWQSEGNTDVAYVGTDITVSGGSGTNQIPVSFSTTGSFYKVTIDESGNISVTLADTSN